MFVRVRTRCSYAARALFVRVRVRCSRVVRTLFVRCSYAVRTSSHERELTRELRDAPLCPPIPSNSTTATCRAISQPIIQSRATANKSSMLALDRRLFGWSRSRWSRLWMAQRASPPPHHPVQPTSLVSAERGRSCVVARFFCYGHSRACTNAGMAARPAWCSGSERG